LRLQSYSIQGESVVLLHFHDNRRLLVEVEDLHHVVNVEDLLKIHEALRLRAQFINKSLPTWAKVVIGMALVGGLGYQAVQMSGRVYQRYAAPPARQPQPVLRHIEQSQTAPDDPPQSATPTAPASEAPPASATPGSPVPVSPSSPVTPQARVEERLAPAAPAPAPSLLARPVHQLSQTAKSLLRPLGL
jgi:hypothetical protein